jgi:hypothetical protein
LNEPWKRSFTYGDVEDCAEWCAQVYLDVDLVEAGLGPEDGFRRILVGAPIWVRTPRLRAVRLYSEFTRDELTASSRPPTHQPAASQNARDRRLFRFLQGR